MRSFKHSAITVATLSLLALLADTAAHAQQTSDIGKITVTGEGDKLGTGLMIDEDTAKAKSTVTKAQIEKSRSSSNPFQMLSLLPGVNATSYDATGLFGGNLRVRGFNSDQMGFTVNGAPVNDSGSFSVFPQEYSDSENLCELSITQGATDTEAPHVGASGGNVTINTCGPEDKQRVRAAVSAGQLSYSRIFLRGDTGKIGDFKGFLSVSKSEADKFRGSGKADRDHVDAAVDYKLGIANLSASLLYNRAITNNFRTLTLSEYNTYGYFADFSNVVPKHVTPVGGTAQVDAGTTAAAPAYYGYALNPFENYLLSAKANIQLTPMLRLDVEPYFWYGYGTGGTQQNTVAESSGSTRIKGGIADINGDGDTLDTVRVYRGSVTNTHRPGVTTKLSYSIDNHRLLAGFWFERARHKQTAPATRIDDNGNIGDIWLRDSSQLLKYADGSLYQNRDVLTISTGESVFVQDTIDLMQSKLTVVPALSYRQIKRDFTNYASGTGAANNSTGADYGVNTKFSNWLPSLSASYQFAPEVQGFVSLSKNMKVPGNFSYFGLANGVAYVNGIGSYKTLNAVSVKQETSVNLDVGTRYKGDMFKGSVTAYYVKFKNRIASSFNATTGITQDYNVGDSTVKGVEIEVGTVPYMGFSAYASGGYTRSTIDGNMPATGTIGNVTSTYPTAGNQMPDTPKGMAALALQWAQGPYMANLSGKFTSGRFLTFTNDLHTGGYTTIDLNLAYQFPSAGPFKNPLIRFNMSNLANTRYFLLNSGSGSNIAINAAGNPAVYSGAPRFSSVTLQSDF